MSNPLAPDCGFVLTDSKTELWSYIFVVVDVPVKVIL